MFSHSHRVLTRAVIWGNIPVMAPQPVVLDQVTAAMRGATPQQVMVAIMKYRKFRSMLACILRE